MQHPRHRARLTLPFFQRYASYKSGLGERVEKGSITFDECEEFVRKTGEPQPQSSRYEHYQNMFNYYVYPPRE